MHSNNLFEENNMNREIKEKLKLISKDGIYILGTSKKIEDIPPKAQDLIIEILEQFSN